MKKYLLFVVLFLLVSCGQESSGTADISEKINEYLGVTPYLPETEYPIGHVHIEYSPKFQDGKVTRGDPFKATIEYNLSQDERADETFKEAWEARDQFREIIYGELYEDQSAIVMNVYNGGPGNLQGADVIEIDGHEVQYQHIQRDLEVVVMLISIKGIGYEIQYLTEENDIEEEAKAFAKEIINNN
ncbi:hypothetical protein [Tenuibacillus multivorans]|uniref:Uncharacterized protein n=1 Tax=Tenuibacillus multivorans TaxID=237069 RepID=A0A1H0A182_9BACI|nr:hypothetical protein [Tenuibacillus multivorans]GEL78353.1 hypothetical protein TMU01_25880 [Tenuibacillus multivorans]SDN27157.1 hypothetical protein SAMN05216498_1918 [Tenuibacillus multivorans]